MLDNNLATRWSHEGVGAWIVADLGASQEVCGVSIGWYKGDTRINHFVIQGSADGASYADLFAGDSRGGLAIEQYSFSPAVARYVRVVVNGNTHNDWASITELQVNVSGGGSILVGQPTPGAPAPTAPTAPTTIPAPTAPAQPTAIPAPTAPPAQPPSGTGSGIWMSRQEIAKLPMSGSGWSRVKSAADGSLGSPNISDQTSEHDTRTLAVALVYARTGQASYRAKAADAILSAIGTEKGGRTLALARNLVSYVIVADLDRPEEL